jgi:hypothetical protein
MQNAPLHPAVKIPGRHAQLRSSLAPSRASPGPCPVFHVQEQNLRLEHQTARVTLLLDEWKIIFSTSSGIIIKWDSVQLTAADLGGRGEGRVISGGESWPVCRRLARRMAISGAPEKRELTKNRLLS